MTTADTPNRIRDKRRVELATGLQETGNDSTRFFTYKGLLVAVGYTRIVYGDHGPYVEFKERHVQIKNLRCSRKGIGYYNKWYPIDNSGILFYEQLKTVEDLPNPPKGKYSVSNRRKEGYADYRVGRWYVSPDDIWVRNSNRLPLHLRRFAV